MLKYSVAIVALLATTSLACAQQTDHGSSNGAAGMSNSASEHAPGQMKDSGSAKDLAPGQNKGEGSSAKDLAPGRMKDGAASKSDEKSNERRSQNETGRSGKDADRNAKNTSDRAKNSDRNAKNDADHNSKNSDRNAKNEGSSDRDHGTKESRSEHSRSSTGASEGSEGRSEHRGSIANVTSEQRTRVKTVFTRHHVEPARNLNVSVNVGVALPRSVHLYPVPEDIVLIVPDYRGYDYIMLDDDRVAIVDPETFEVVDIIVIA